MVGLGKVTSVAEDRAELEPGTDALRVRRTDHSATLPLKVARYSFSRSIPPKFERKLRRHKQGFGKIDTTVVLDKEENWL